MLDALLTLAWVLGTCAVAFNQDPPRTPPPQQYPDPETEAKMRRVRQGRPDAPLKSPLVSDNREALGERGRYFLGAAAPTTPPKKRQLGD